MKWFFLTLFANEISALGQRNNLNNPIEKNNSSVTKYAVGVMKTVNSLVLNSTKTNEILFCSKVSRSNLSILEKIIKKSLGQNYYKKMFGNSNWFKFFLWNAYNELVWQIINKNC